MKKYLTILLAALMIATALLTFVACDRRGVHTAVAEWSHDETNHWHKCTDCDDIVFGNEPHSFTYRDGKKTCTKCGYSADCTTEENFACWAQGRNNALDLKDNYTVHYTMTERDENGNVAQIRTATESRKGNKFFRVEKEEEAGDDGKLVVTSNKTTAVKAVTDEGKNYIKYFYKSEYADGPTENETYGAYVPPYYTDELAHLYPFGIIGMSDIEKGDTYDEFRDKTTASRGQGDALTFALVRNDDGSVTLTITATYDESGKDYSGNPYTVSGTDTQKVTVANGRIVEIVYSEKYTNSDDSSDNATTEHYDYTTRVTYEYDVFDEQTYNGISVDTDTTENMYTARIYFFINGYEAAYAHGLEVPVYETANTDDIRAYFADVDRHKGWLVVDNNEFIQNAEFYTDEAMTTPFTTFTPQTDDDITLYIRLTAPSDNAWVLTIVPYDRDIGGNGLKYIQDCRVESDGRLTFNTDQRISGYPVVSVDGQEPSDDNEYVFEKGTIHVAVCRSNRDEFGRTDSENFNDWKNGIDNTLATNDDYTTHYKNMFYTDDVLDSGTVGTESRDGNNYFDKHTQYATHPQTNEQTSVSETVSAVKLVQDGDVTRTKFFHQNKLLVGGEQTDKQGSYVQPNYAEQLLNFVPSQNYYLEYFAQGATFTELKQYTKSAWGGNGKFKFTLTRTSEVAVTLTMTVSYVGTDADSNGDEYNYSGTDVITITVEDDYVTAVTYTSDYDITYDDESKNYTGKELSEFNFEYSFDQATYDEISVETDTTENRYKAIVRLYLNGYAVDVTSVPVGGKLTLDDVKAVFTDKRGTAHWLVVDNDEFVSQMKVYTDKEATTPFVELTAESNETIPLYVQISAATEGNAWVINVVPSRGGTDELVVNIMQGCMHQQDGRLTYNPSNRMPGYTLVSVDGVPTVASDIMEFESGTVHVLIWKAA